MPVSASEKGEREAGFELFWPGLLLQGCCLLIRGSSREGRKEVERTTRERDQGMVMLVVLLFLSPGRKMMARA